MVQIIKLIVVLDNNTAGEHKMHFKNDAFMYYGEKSNPDLTDPTLKLFTP